jgi:ribosomal RNA-processing protein 12
MSTGNLIENSDAAIQKKTYRILTRLIETGKATALNGEGADDFVKRLVAVGENIGPGAQRVSGVANPGSEIVYADKMAIWYLRTACSYSLPSFHAFPPTVYTWYRP